MLSRNHTKLVPEKLSFDNNLCDGEENRQKTDEQLIETKRLVEGDNTLKLLHNVAHRLQEDGNETGTRQTQSRKIGLQQANQSKDSNTGNPDEDLLDIIDKTNWATSRENVSLGIFDQVRLQPACSTTQAS